MTKLFPAYSLMFLFGCGILGPTADTVNLRPLVPVPIEYQGWYGEVQSCVGETREFGGIVFFVADELYLAGRDAGGIWSPPNRIIMRRDHVLSQRAVKHELIHYIRDELGHAPVYDLCSR